MATIETVTDAGERDLGQDSYAALAAASLPHPAEKAPGLLAEDRKATILRERADRVRGWYLLAVNHPLWRRYIPAAREDEGFYIGGDLQWSKDGSFDSLHRLRAAKRTTVSINHIQSTVDILVGFERQNRYDLKATQEGNEDAEHARVLSWLLRFAQDQAEVQEYESEMFEDGLIRGMAALDVKGKWTGEGLDGEIELEVLTPGEDFLVDPYFKRYDYGDARFTMKFRWSFLDEVVAHYPDHEAIITQQVALLDSLFLPLLANQSTDGGRGDAYGSVSGPNADRLQEEEQFYDPRDRRILAIECWYREFVQKFYVVTKGGQQHAEVASKAAAMELVAVDPTNLTWVQRTVRQIRECLVLPATHTTLYDQPSRYDNDPENYPQVGYWAKRKRDWVYGIVRNMKDPQLLENTRISQLSDILRRWANIRPLVPKGAVEDERGLEDHWSTSAIVYDPKKGAPDWYVPRGLELVARGLLEIATLFKLNLREITGINTDLLGQDTSGSAGNSGIAIARRQAQGQIIATIFFDNFKRTRKLVGQRLARRIQQCFTTEQILRLIDPDTGDPVEVLINPAEASEMDPEEFRLWAEQRTAQRRDGQGRPYVLRSLKALKFDVKISEAPATPSARATQLMALLELLRIDPRILPALIDRIVALADISDRSDILRKIRALQAQAGIPVGDPNVPGGQPVVPGDLSMPSAPSPLPPGPAPSTLPPAAVQAAGIQPAAPPPIPPTPGPAPGPIGRNPGTSTAMRRTLALASGGGGPVGPGPV